MKQLIILSLLFGSSLIVAQSINPDVPATIEETQKFIIGAWDGTYESELTGESYTASFSFLADSRFKTSKNGEKLGGTYTVEAPDKVRLIYRNNNYRQVLMKLNENELTFYSYPTQSPPPFPFGRYTLLKTDN